MQSKCEKRKGGNIALAGGGREKADAAKEKKGSSKRGGLGLENPGEGAAGALVFLGINVTVLLLDQRRHKEPMSSRG